MINLKYIILKISYFITVNPLWLLMLFVSLVVLIIYSALIQDVISSRVIWTIVLLIGTLLIIILWIIRMLTETVPTDLEKKKVNR